MKRALIASVAAFALVHAFVAFWTPVQGDAWLHWVWAGRHPEGGASAWVLSHLAFSDAIGYVLARFAWVHVLVSPLVAVALVAGTCTIALRRVPRATDLLPLALVSALIWIAQPHPGMTWFYTQSVAAHVYGAAIAVWLVAAARCDWTVPWPLAIAGAYCVGTSTRAIAVVTLVAVIVLARRKPTMRVLLGALAVATIFGFARAPYFEIGKVVRRGLDPNLFVLKMPVEAIGKLVALVAVFALVELGRRVFGRASSDEGQPDARASAWLVIGYLGTSVLCIFGPRYYEATLLPATLVLVVGAVPWLMWFARQRGYRITLVAFVIAVHVVAWAVSLASYRWIGEEGSRRMALIAGAKPGEVVTVPPYSEILASNWFFGEDFSTARLRQLVAVEAFGLRGIEVAPEFRRLELDPHVVVELQVDGVTPEQLAAARPPKIWSTVPSVAREQFDDLVSRLDKAAAVEARLVVTNSAFADAKARPLLLAWARGGELVSPRVAISALDEENNYTIKMYNELSRFNEAWWIQSGVKTKIPYRNGSPRIRPPLPVSNEIVVCNAERCLLADAFVPHF